MQLIQGNQDYLYAKSISTFEDIVNTLLEHKKEVVIAIPGGRTVVNLFELFRTANVNWNKIIIFMVDERLVPLDDPESNYNLALRHFIKFLIENNKISEDNIFPFHSDPIQAQVDAFEYEIALKQHGSKFDIVFLSSGEDGHVAGVYPNHRSYNNEDDFFYTYDNCPKLPAERMTASRTLIKKSSHSFLFFVGATKQKALARFLDENISEKSCPAKMVNSIPNSYIFTDQDPNLKNEEEIEQLIPEEE